MNRLIFIACLFLFFACQDDVAMKMIPLDDLFHDRTSKVWLVDQVWLDNANISSQKDEEKDVMIFHKNGIIDLIAMKNITRRPPEKGEFIIQGNILTINYPERVDIFYISYVYEDSILLTPKQESDNQYKIQLKPFKEL